MTILNHITAERVRQMLDYEPETGRLIWRPGFIPKRVHTDGRAGCVYSGGWRFLQIDRKTYAATTIIWLWMTGTFPENEIDHADLDRANDRWLNLRPATGSQNCGNRGLHSTNTSGFKGVTFEPRCKGRPWRARFQAGGKKTNLGQFASAEEAAEAFDRAADAFYGEFYRPK